MAPGMNSLDASIGTQIPTKATIAFLQDLSRVLPASRVSTDAAGKALFRSDAFTLAGGAPSAVVFPESTAEAAAVMQVLAAHRLAIVPRGSGTGLAGGAAPVRGEVVVCTSRLNRIIELDLPGRTAHVQSGVLNGQLNDAIAKQAPHLHFAPDPSSARAATIGGNAAANAGGVHTLKDFVTSNHILGVTVVLDSGEVLTTRGMTGVHASPPFDLTALLCGSEGTLALITELRVKLVPKRGGVRTLLALFDSAGDAGRAVAGIIATGILPAALEMMDGTMIRVIEDAYHFGIPAGTTALLVIELDGDDALLDGELAEVRAVLTECHATDLRAATTPDDRAKLWKARKSAFGAIGKLSHSYCTQDACVPRSKLPLMLERIHQAAGRYGLTISNVFHAGDGNVHPIFLYDDCDPAQVANALAACREVLLAALELGGTLTGEHGIGVEKVGLMPAAFDSDTLAAFVTLKLAFAPSGRLNPGKLLPTDPSLAIIRL
jgi:glycolate oxidase